MCGGQDKPAWTACPPGVKITRVGGKITRDSLPPGGQAVQGGKINCYTGNWICRYVPPLKMRWANYISTFMVDWFSINSRLGFYLIWNL